MSEWTTETVTPTAPSLSVVVTESMIRAISTNDNWPSLLSEEAHEIITTILNHPDVLAQIRRQVVACVPPEEMDGHNDYYASGWYRAIERTRASLGRLLGEST